jgi:hypothetical protein
MRELHDVSALLKTGEQHVMFSPFAPPPPVLHFTKAIMSQAM